MGKLPLFIVISGSMAVIAACSSNGAGGYEPVFRKEFSGAGCRALKIESGPSEKICAKSPAWEAACSAFVRPDNSAIGIVYGTYEGPVCLWDHDACGAIEKIDFVGAALKMGRASWGEPAGRLVLGDRTIDVRATLRAGCSAAAKEESQPRAKVEADLEKMDYQAVPAWTPDAHRRMWISVGGKLDDEDVSRCSGLQAVQSVVGDDEFESKRKERERERLLADCEGRARTPVDTKQRYRLEVPLVVGAYDFDRRVLPLTVDATQLAGFTTMDGISFLTPSPWMRNPEGLCYQAPPLGLLSLSGAPSEVTVPAPEADAKLLKERLSRPGADVRVQILFTTGDKVIKTRVNCSYGDIKFQAPGFDGTVVAIRVVDSLGTVVP